MLAKSTETRTPFIADFSVDSGFITLESYLPMRRNFCSIFDLHHNGMNFLRFSDDVVNFNLVVLGYLKFFNIESFIPSVKDVVGWSVILCKQN